MLEWIAGNHPFRIILTHYYRSLRDNNRIDINLMFPPIRCQIAKWKILCG